MEAGPNFYSNYHYSKPGAFYQSPLLSLSIAATSSDRPMFSMAFAVGPSIGLFLKGMGTLRVVFVLVLSGEDDPPRIPIECLLLVPTNPGKSTFTYCANTI